MKDRLSTSSVVGSGAGGGVVAGELAQRGRDVLLLEAGPHRTAADFMRWEAHANHDIWWPLRLAPLPDGDVVAFLAGRCVGGTTTINTKVALRAHERDVAKWHAATGLTNDGRRAVRGVRPRPVLRPGRAGARRPRADGLAEERPHGRARLPRARASSSSRCAAYTDANCMRCGSCLQGCATNAGKSTMNTYIHDALARGLLELRAEAVVERVLIEDSRATGVEYVDDEGERQVVLADAVVVAGGRAQHSAAARAQRRRQPERRASTSACTRCVSSTGSSTSRRTRTWSTRSPPTAWTSSTTRRAASSSRRRRSRIRSASRRRSGTSRGRSGGRGSSRQCGASATGSGCWPSSTTRTARRWSSTRTAASASTSTSSRSRRSESTPSLDFSREGARGGGREADRWTGLASTHVQGSCRMGDDPARSVVDRNGESHDVKRLFVGDSSLIPRTLSVNPSLTIMALATRVAERIDADPNGYLSATSR